MRKLTALAGVAALGLSTQAFGYGASGTVTFSWGGNYGGTAQDTTVDTTSDIGWTSNGVSSISSISNSTYFTTLSNFNSRAYYNPNFATSANCVAGGGGSVVPAGSTAITRRKYGCRYNTYPGGTPSFTAIPTADQAAAETGASATGSITVTDTTLTGTLTLNSTTDEPTGTTTTFAASGMRLGVSAGNGSNGFNYRTADGSPFGNVWWGYTTAGTLVLNLTGTFTSSSWDITGGAVTWGDSGFACQQGGNSTPADILCALSTNAGGVMLNGGQLSWGSDLDGAGSGITSASMFQIRDTAGTSVLSTISGVLASISVSGGSLTTNSGEFRRGSGGTGCADFLKYDGTKISCGTLTSGRLSVSGTVEEDVIPVPAAVWLMGSALGLLGWIRRKTSA